MCGIAGVVTREPTEPDSLYKLLEKMSLQLNHRGPDHREVSLFDKGGFAHTRLSIIDLDSRSNQPFWNQERTCCLVFNGEIYNFKQLRNQLALNDYPFRTQSDTEVILALYEKKGISALTQLRGIFAFALWDVRSSSLYLVRDPLGIKPLYYSQQNHKIVFASEIKALFCDSEIDTNINAPQINHFFTFGHTSCPKTAFNSVEQVEPGHFISFDSNGSKSTKFWNWDIEDKLENTFSEKLELFQENLLTAVKSQTLSDVPMASFLSGGLDSSALAWSLKELKIPDINLVSFAFKDKSYDESSYAKQTSDFLDLNLEVIDTDLNLRDLPEKISRHLEDPMADSSSLAMYLLCQSVSKKYKVAFSGDGADEVLAGYETYTATSLSNYLQKKSLAHPLSSLKTLTGLLKKSDQPYSFYQKSNRFLSYVNQPFPRNHACWRTHFSQQLKEKLYSKDYYEGLIGQLEQPYKDYENAHSSLGLRASWLDQALSMDLTYYLTNDMLIKVDRMSMANGLEVRVPFLDVDFIRFCFRLSDSDRLKQVGMKQSKKHILREFLRHKVPPETVQRKKRGFMVPISQYLRELWLDQALDLLSTHKIEMSQFLNIKSVETIIEDFKNKDFDGRFEIFDILMFCLWFENRKKRFQ